MPRPTLRRTPVSFTGPPAADPAPPKRRVLSVNERKAALLPLPLASDVGLEPAFRQLESLLAAEPMYRPEYGPGGARKRIGYNPFGGQVLLPHQLDPADPLVRAAVEEWNRRHTLRWPGVGRRPRSPELPVADGGSPVRLAIQAAEQHQTWVGRRRVASTPEARREVRRWAEAVAQHTPAAVEIVDGVAGTLNAAASGAVIVDGVVLPPAPSWH